MIVADDVQRRVETYLATVRRRLRPLDRDLVDDVVEELRSHILDRAAAGGTLTAGGVDAALAALGTPEALAGEYLTDELLARAAVSRSPVRVVESLFRWASLSISGFLVLSGALLGYFLGGVLLVAALSRPFHPAAAGLWTFSGAGDLTVSLRLGFGTPPPGGRELLGWWLVPLGLAGGYGLIILTTWLALAGAGRFRRSPMSSPR
ncbi:MAG TPA: hypothetical protein VGV61_02810 [Thermoanaerobaculia bacterium]|jgi:uncharacterized membrane protein|nr:hypothetical protein [Thermoanaerobaculia bacterium]